MPSSYSSSQPARKQRPQFLLPFSLHAHLSQIGDEIEDVLLEASFAAMPAVIQSSSKFHALET